MRSSERGIAAAVGLVAFLLLLTGAAPAGANRTSRSRGEAGAPLFEAGRSTSRPPAPIETPWARDVSRAHPLPEYPRPQLTRPQWLNLNGRWQFEAAASLGKPPVGKTLAQRILVPFSPESTLSGIGHHYDYMWYRRRFQIPREWLPGRNCRLASCQRVLLHFGAVNYASVVYVNGRLVAEHTGGYDSFDVDITGALKRRGSQELVVGVTNLVQNNPADQVIGKQRSTFLGAIYYEPSSGIWQTVWVEPVPRAHITRLAMTPDLGNDTLQLTAFTAGGANQRVTATAYAGHRRVGRVSGPADEPLSVPVRRPRLWTPQDPFLYTLTVSLTVGGRRIDQVGSYFGMRSISVGMYDGQPHILLNGRFVFELGTLEQGYWPDGVYTAPTDAAIHQELAEIKALGFNTIRKHMKVEPDRWYYWADRLGLLVWQDMPALASTPTTPSAEAQFNTELHAMVTQLQNHPSIVVWTPFNEGWGEFDPAGIANEIRAWDPSRLIDVDSGQNCCASLPDTGAGDIYDGHEYPNPFQLSPFDRRAVVDGEFGGLGLYVPGHSWGASGWAYEIETSPAELTLRYAELLTEVRNLEIHCGLSGAIYTQAYDVQFEINGLRTYDRTVLKANPKVVRDANESVLAAARSLQPQACPAAK